MKTMRSEQKNSFLLFISCASYCKTKPYYCTLIKNPDKAISKMFEKLPLSDRRAFDNPRIKQLYTDTIREAFRAGPNGVSLIR